MQVRRYPVCEARRTRVAGALRGWRWQLTQIIDIEQKLIMMVTSGLDFHGTEGNRLVACPEWSAGFDAACGRTLSLPSMIRADSVGIASREDPTVPPTSLRPATVARRCGPRGQQ
jgi:hypothetical protein